MFIVFVCGLIEFYNQNICLSNIILTFGGLVVYNTGGMNFNIDSRAELE